MVPVTPPMPGVQSFLSCFKKFEIMIGFTSMRNIYIFLFTLLACFFSSSLIADATITGVVTSQSSGNPISGASMALIKGSQNIVATTTTAGDGSYTFAGIKPGQYSVRASAFGFDTQIVGAKARKSGS